MDIETYNSIVSLIKKHRRLPKDCLPMLEKKFPNVHKNTLASIISHEYRKRMRVNHIKSVEVMNKYYELYCQALARGDKPGILIDIALQFDITPYLVAKMVLEKHLIELNTSAGCSEVANIKAYLRDTSLIQDPVLAYEIYLCNLFDDQYSPIVDIMKMSIGQEYEIRLHRELTSLGLAFRDEEYLRKYGYDKTPDVKLELPVAVDGFIINWVESKALFGDKEVHKEYMNNQYLSYWNRFGSGLVIYWFGFMETLTNRNEKRLIIRDHFPSNLTHIIPPKSEEVTAINR